MDEDRCGMLWMARVSYGIGCALIVSGLLTGAVWLTMKVMEEIL